MGIVRNEIEIPDSEPFVNDMLGRKETAEKLTALLTDADGPLVVSVNGRWGTGKTTFVKMWDQMLRNQGKAKSFTFNAWENDFFADPGVAFIDEITTSLSEDDQFDRSIKQKAKEFKETASTLIPSILGVTVGKQVADIAGGLLEAYQEEKAKIVEFRDELTNVANRVVEENGAPLIIFVDELDRCRPDFAVKLLEQIKHLFDVTGIVFVLSVDLSQLKGSVKSLYGEDVETGGYLRRFIDLRYQLPRPEDGDYIEFLFEQNGTKEALTGAGYQVLKMAKACSEVFGMSLRGKEQYMLRLDLTFRQLEAGPGLPPRYFRAVAPFLIALRMERYALYQNLLKGSSLEKGLEEARKFSLKVLGSEIGSDMKPQHLLEAAVRTLYANDDRDFTGEIKGLKNELDEARNEVNNSDLGGEGLRKKVGKERRLDGVHSAIRKIKSDGGKGLMERTREAIELAGSIDRV
jgi:cytidylate kinase